MVYGATSFEFFHCSAEVHNGSYTFKIDIQGHPEGVDVECQNAVVCKLKDTGDDAPMQNLADVSTAKYFMEGETNRTLSGNQTARKHLSVMCFVDFLPVLTFS